MKAKQVICLTAAVCMFAAGCGKQKTGGSKFYTDGKAEIKPQQVADAYPDKDYGFQLDKPETGEETAVLHTNLGDIHIRLFPEGAPKAVENFKGLINGGKYNGVIFHRVINDFMIQGGDYEKADGTGGASIWGENFEDEFQAKLLNIRGAVSMANSGANTNGSQFFVNQAGPDGFSKNLYEDSVYGVPDAVWKLYEKYGGNIHLDGAFRQSGGHTVFGQVFEGMDVVDKIASAEKDSNDKPLTDIVITSAEVIKYEG